MGKPEFGCVHVARSGPLQSWYPHCAASPRLSPQAAMPVAPPLAGLNLGPDRRLAGREKSGHRCLSLSAWLGQFCPASSLRCVSLGSNSTPPGLVHDVVINPGPSLSNSFASVTTPFQVCLTLKLICKNESTDLNPRPATYYLTSFL